MGIYTDLTTGSTSITDAKPRVGLDRSSAHQLLKAANRHDPDIGAAFAAQDELTTIPEQTDAGVADTYTLTLTFPVLGIAFTTAAIPFDDTAAEIETAIDTANVSPVVNTHITVDDVGSAGVSDGAVTLTFDGASVNETPCVVTLAATGFTAVEPIVRTTPGQGDRPALQTLIALNALAGAVHDIGDPVTSFTKPASVGQSRPGKSLLRDLALQTIVEEGSDDVYDQVVSLYPEVTKF